MVHVPLPHLTNAFSLCDSNWWRNLFTVVKFPVGSSVFDYTIHPETKRFVPWIELASDIVLARNSYQDVLIPTTETLSVSYMTRAMLRAGHPVLLVGPTGCGKSVLMRSVLSELDEDVLVQQYAFSHYTTSESLQQKLEEKLERRIGRNFAPVGNRNMIFFIDDFNMPAKDAYGTQCAHALLRQHLSYGHWFDRNKFSAKKVLRFLWWEIRKYVLSF
jgi:dynein heavy chain, axonemal